MKAPLPPPPSRTKNNNLKRLKEQLQPRPVTASSSLGLFFKPRLHFKETSSQYYLLYFELNNNFALGFELIYRYSAVGLNFILFKIYMGLKRRIIANCKALSFDFMQNVSNVQFFEHMHSKFAKSVSMTHIFSSKLVRAMGYQKRRTLFRSNSLTWAKKSRKSYKKLSIFFLFLRIFHFLQLFWLIRKLI